MSEEIKKNDIKIQGKFEYNGLIFNSQAEIEDFKTKEKESSPYSYIVKEVNASDKNPEQQIQNKNNTSNDPLLLDAEQIKINLPHDLKLVPNSYLLVMKDKKPLRIILSDGRSYNFDGVEPEETKELDESLKVNGQVTNFMGILTNVKSNEIKTLTQSEMSKRLQELICAPQLNNNQVSNQNMCARVLKNRSQSANHQNESEDVLGL